jgi:hypothetical protein
LSTGFLLFFEISDAVTFSSLSRCIMSPLSMKQNNPEELSRALNLFFKSRSKGLDSDEAKLIASWKTDALI